MKRVTITLCKTRYRWGNLIDCRPSRFIREIDPKYLKTAGGMHNGPSGRTMAEEEETENSMPSPRIKNPVIRRIVPSAGKPATKSLIDETLVPDDPALIQSGMTVIHSRFGTGKVLQIEGEGINRMATVFFKDSGTKQLLLKFARLKICKV
jgi:DNA helicase-2/ATP-dependent DNA helicase PcrA